MQGFSAEAASNDQTWQLAQVAATLAGQFAASGRNAMFIAPEAPIGVFEPGVWQSLPELLAEVRRDYVDPPAPVVRHQGRDVIALGVSMRKGGDIIALGKALKAELASIERSLPAGMQLVQVQDQPATVATSVNEFVKVLIEAVVVVLLVQLH